MLRRFVRCYFIAIAFLTVVYMVALLPGWEAAGALFTPGELLAPRFQFGLHAIESPAIDYALVILLNAFVFASIFWFFWAGVLLVRRLNAPDARDSNSIIGK